MSRRRRLSSLTAVAFGVFLGPALAQPPAEVNVTGHDVRLWFDDRLQVVMKVTRGEGEHLLRLEGTITNRRSDHRLRLHVRLPAGVSESLAGAPFELVRRPVLGEGGEVEVASPTWPARGLVMAGSTAVFSHGVFEYELTGGELAVTLLRCVGTISRGFLSTRPLAAGPDVATPLAQMIGDTTFSLGVEANARASELQADYERFALPLSVTTSTGGGRLAKTGALLEITGDAQISNVRRRDGLADQLRSERVAAPAHVQLRIRVRGAARPRAAILRADAHVADDLDRRAKAAGESS